MTRRRGYSLIEMLVVITSGTLMLALCVGMIHMVLRLDHGGRSQMAERAARGRLAQSFRADIHAALRTDPADGRSGRIVLFLPGEQVVEYRIEPGRVLRTRTEAGDLKNQDAFAFPRKSVARLELESRAGQTLAGLVIEDQDRTAPAAVAAGQFRVEGVVARDHRFEAGKER